MIPIVLAIAAVTAATFYLNAVFGLAVSGPRPPEVRPAFGRARQHLVAILFPGVVVGLIFGLSTVVVTRWGTRWFAISLGVVVAVMMVCCVAVLARLVGVKKPERLEHLNGVLEAVLVLDLDKVLGLPGRDDEYLSHSAAFRPVAASAASQ